MQEGTGEEGEGAAYTSFSTMAAEHIQEQLQMVEKELRQVQDQINILLEHQEKLLHEQAELQCLLTSCQDEHNHEAVKADKFAEDADNWAGKFPWDKGAEDTRLNIFGISSYRINQCEIVNAIMSGRDVVVIMAAGGGKSLCYQLPALLLPGTTLVVSPLLSLIQDQVMGLSALGVSARMLNSTTTKEEEKTIYHILEKGDAELKILYVTPEKIAKSKRFMSKLEKCNHVGRLSLIAIDEAHCCSQWGHDFRPDYKNLSILKKQFPKVPMVALTATATSRVQIDLREMLQISRCVTFLSTVNRPNLFYEVREKSSNAQAVINDIADFIRQSYGGKGSGIVYCFSRKDCEQVAKELCQRGISATYYHADMDEKSRTSVHFRWSSNKLQVIVATVAFGMGINKPDVRFVIHHSISKSLETYYQESGRAGRDGYPSHCLLFFRPADLCRQSSMVFYEHAGLQNLYAIARYCLLKRQCRRLAFFNHFGEESKECNGMCDNCAFTHSVINKDVTVEAKTLVSLVKDVEDREQKVTLLQLVDLWKSNVRKSGEHQSDTSLKKEDLERIIVLLLLDGILKEEFQHTAYATNAYVTIGSSWRSLLQGQRKILLEVSQGQNTKKQYGRTEANTVKNQAVDSGMAAMLDDFCQRMAQAQDGIFPYAVLTSQQISELSVVQPTTLSEVEKVIGSRKMQKYGQDLLDAIKDYISRNSESPQPNGEWVSTRKVCLSAPVTTVTKGLKKHSIDRKTASGGKIKKLSTNVTAEIKSGQRQLSACIDLDSDKDALGCKETKSISVEINDDDDDDDDDFILFKRIKR